jgi:PAS domain-containing protein
VSVPDRQRPPAAGRVADARAPGLAVGDGTDAPAREDGAHESELAACRRALADAESARSTLDRILALVGIGAWEADLESGTVWWSDTLCRMHGVSPGYRPALTRTVEYYAPESRARMAAALRNSMDEGGPWDLELDLLTVAGRCFRARALGRVVFVEGEAARLVGTLQVLGDGKTA